MGTRAQIDVRQGNKVIRLYSQYDSYPRNILPALRAAASAGYSKPSSIARAIIKYFPDDFGMRVITEDRADVSYRYTVDASSKPWRVRQTRTACYEMPTNADGSLDDSFTTNKLLPAVTRSFRIGK